MSSSLSYRLLKRLDNSSLVSCSSETAIRIYCGYTPRQLRFLSTSLIQASCFLYTATCNAHAPTAHWHCTVVRPRKNQCDNKKSGPLQNHNCVNFSSKICKCDLGRDDDTHANFNANRFSGASTEIGEM